MNFLYVITFGLRIAEWQRHPYFWQDKMLNLRNLQVTRLRNGHAVSFWYFHLFNSQISTTTLMFLQAYRIMTILLLAFLIL